jgi:hypothetical protein
MAANSLPYVQDTDQWVAYYLDMAEKKVLDHRNAYVTAQGAYLYPVEKKRVVFREKEEEPEKVKDLVKVELVTPIQQTVEQVKEEVKEQKEDPTGPAPVELDIKVPEKVKTFIRKRAGAAATGVTRVRDQLSKKSRQQ